MAGAANRAFKESLEKLDDKVQSLDDKIDSEFQTLNENFNKIIKKLDRQLEIEKDVAEVREVVNRNLLINNKKLLLRINT